MFAHLSVLISVILGLALTHLLGGSSKLIQPAELCVRMAAIRIW
ncbi:MAG: hypothetical protein ABI846_06275 [Rudaea sp.]